MAEQQSSTAWHAMADDVPGDVLVLETGDRVAADARVLSSEDLHVDESALTGESQAVAKGPGPVDEDEVLKKLGVYGRLGVRGQGIR